MLKSKEKNETLSSSWKEKSHRYPGEGGGPHRHRAMFSPVTWKGFKGNLIIHFKMISF